MRSNLGLFLTKRAFLTPHREGYVDSRPEGIRLTFLELNRRCNQVANALLADGIQEGERTALLIMNSAEFMETYFALAKVGAVIVPLNWRLVADELEFILKDSGATRLIYGAEFIDAATELHGRGDRTDIGQWLQVEGSGDVPHFAQSYETFRDAATGAEPEPRGEGDDRLYIMYTSGTTGLPKGVVHTHNTSIWAIHTIAANADYHDGDRYLSALPMFHVGALTPLAVNVHQGATSVVMRSFDPVWAWQLIEQERITGSLMVPAMMSFMAEVRNNERYDHSGLRWIMTGGEPVPVALLRRYADMGIRARQGYGLTEACGPVCLMDSENALIRPDSAGKPYFHTSIRVVDAAGNDCPPGALGEVLVSGPHVMVEYWNRPQATAETLVDGWLHTGDVAVMDADGYISIRDRLKDLIISGGENIHPAEVEGVLLAHPDILEAAVIGVPSESWGESPMAIVVRRGESLSEADVLNHCIGKMAGYKQPKLAVFVDEMPRNPSGKILKRVLREQFTGPAPA